MLLESKKNLSGQENSKLVILTSGHREFRQYAEYAEGGDTASTSHTQKSPCAEREKYNIGRPKRVLRSPAGPRRRRKRTHAVGVHPLSSAILSVAIPLADRDRAVAEGGKAPVSPCEPLCAILLRKPSVYPLSPAKANAGRLCEKLKNAMRNGLEQRCGGNFLAIFAGNAFR